jgi:hypothetical protein
MADLKMSDFVCFDAVGTGAQTAAEKCLIADLVMSDFVCTAIEAFPRRCLRHGITNLYGGSQCGTPEDGGSCIEFPFTR